MKLSLLGLYTEDFLCDEARTKQNKILSSIYRYEHLWHPIIGVKGHLFVA